MPRWRINEGREILPAGLAQSQRVTLIDIRAGWIRFPREAKRYFPTERDDVQLVLRGLQLKARYNPRTGPDKERSAVLVLLVGKANLEELVQVDEVLSISLADGIVQLD